jgi:hypothetical protein
MNKLKWFSGALTHFGKQYAAVVIAKNKTQAIKILAEHQFQVSSKTLKDYWHTPKLEYLDKEELDPASTEGLYLSVNEMNYPRKYVPFKNFSKKIK